jgi:hypothetical protein
MSDPLERLRDTFAAAALTGLLANPHDDLLASDNCYATSAYELADAMLRERGNQSEKPNSSPTLTAEERAAILTAADLLIGSMPGATLRKLLERFA